jgi:hypothetical protein
MALPWRRDLSLGQKQSQINDLCGFTDKTEELRMFNLSIKYLNDHRLLTKYEQFINFCFEKMKSTLSIPNICESYNIDGLIPQRANVYGVY